jgi:dinuclear metal center YbgI/SA1388 family protein
MLISEFLSALETIVPLKAAGYERDAIGLQVGLPSGTELTAALFAYEVTGTVISEARKRGANLIVAFHPLIFPNVSAITDRTRTGNLLRDLIKSDIALYVQHTAFDTQPEFGTSILMATALGLEEVTTLSRISPTIQPQVDGRNFGMGAIGNWHVARNRKEVLQLAHETFKPECVRYNSSAPARIKTIAMVGGAGMEYYDAARSLGADAFITADVRYHDFHRADHDNILLIDAGHAETEKFVIVGMLNAARKAMETMDRKAPGLEVKAPETNSAARKAVNLHGSDAQRILLLARSKPNAVRYYCPTNKRSQEQSQRGVTAALNEIY